MMKILWAICVGWVVCVHAVAAEPASSSITPSFVQMAQQSFEMRHVQGRLKGDETAEYAVQAEQGQTLTVRVESPHRSLYFNVFPPASPTAIFNGSIQGNQFEGVVQHSGEYRVQVYLMRSAARRNEQAEYALTIMQNQSQMLQQTGEQLTRNLIIFYDREQGVAALLAAAQSYGANVIYQYQHLNGIAVAIPAGKEMQDAIRYFERVKGVLQVNQDSILQLQVK